MLLYPSRLCFPVQLPILNRVTQKGGTPVSQSSQDADQPLGGTV